jgi:hypothetical protein
MASSEGCRVVHIAEGQLDHVAFSYDHNQGLVAWSERAGNGDIVAMRFSIDQTLDKGSINLGDPSVVLELQHPTETDNSREIPLDLDVWVDYSTSTPAELVAVTSLVDFDRGSDQASSVRSIKVLDLSNPLSANTVWSITSDYALSCMGSGPSFDPRTGDGHLCLVPAGRLFFTRSASYLFFHSESDSGPFEQQWAAMNRIERPIGGWMSGTSTPELIYAHQNNDCAPGSMPVADDAIVIDVPGRGPREVLVANACIGFQSGEGLRDQRLYFLDAESCASDPSKQWDACHLAPPTLYSGEIHGRGASWRSDGQVLYNGFTDATLDSIRVFDPLAAPAVNDRELIRKGVLVGGS